MVPLRMSKVCESVEETYFWAIGSNKESYSAAFFTLFAASSFLSFLNETPLGKSLEKQAKFIHVDDVF